MLRIRSYVKRNFGFRWFNSERHTNHPDDPFNVENDMQKSNWWAKQLSSSENWNNTIYCSHKPIEEYDTNVNKSNGKKTSTD
jgi:hypothetical protein